jgi:hypothetical protein
VAWDGTGNVPTASSINFAAGQVVPNMAFVPSEVDTEDPTGTSVFAVVNNSTASTNVIVDVVGVVVANQTEGFRFETLAPTRIVDSRSGLGGVQSPIGANATRTYTAPSSVVGDTTWFLVANATAIAPTAATYMTISETGTTRPNVSNLNVAQSEVAANAAVVPLSAENQFDVYNNVGSVNFALDVAGVLNEYSVPAAGLAKASPSFDGSGTPKVAPRR